MLCWLPVLYDMAGTSVGPEVGLIGAKWIDCRLQAWNEFRFESDHLVGKNLQEAVRQLVTRQKQYTQRRIDSGKMQIWLVVAAPLL